MAFLVRKRNVGIVPVVSESERAGKQINNAHIEGGSSIYIYYWCSFGR